jgi:hypothetical protein
MRLYNEQSFDLFGLPVKREIKNNQLTRSTYNFSDKYLVHEN